ncbi:MAG: type IV pilus secretin PilQ [Thermodesulfovibrio sp.]|nr:type IV pilus secretin PilQ [Thermodesulfovibrio sp.]MDW7998717.1 type IV pilus secretin PilQ [Thermodesulfovibrio sp.]
MKNKILIILIFILYFAFMGIAEEIKNIDPTLNPNDNICFECDFIKNKIQSISYEGDFLKVYLQKKTEFKVIAQDDPFKIRIELKNTLPGILNKKLFYREGIISEISAQIHNNKTFLDILLVEPLKPLIKMENNVLFISFISPTDSISKNEIRAKIIEIMADQTEEGIEISIQADGELPEPSITRFDDHIDVAFNGVVLETELLEDIPVTVKRQGDGLILSFLYGGEFDFESLHLGDELVLSLKKRENKVAKKEEPKSSINPVSNFNKEERTISLDFQDADIVGVFRLIGDIAGYNIVIHPDVKGKITLKLINVPWLQAVDIICKTFQLEKIFVGNILRIAPVKVFQEEKKLEAEIKDLFKKAEDEQYRIFVLKHASPDKVKAAIEGAKILSPKGNISIDERTRVLIVRDIPSVLESISNLIDNLDKPTRQILLEARILEISSSFSKSIGFEWGINWYSSDTRTSVIGSAGAGTTGSPSPVPGGFAPLGINLPASSGVITGPTTAFTVGYLNKSQTLALNLRISALQQTGRGKIISNPKVITLDNQKAKIVQGASIPYGEKDVQSGQISTKFRDVAITVEATPHLIDDKSMLLDLSVVKEDLVEFVNIGGVYAPRTTKIEGNTKVSLRDGETLVIGGIFKKSDSMTESKVPGLGDIPLIGELFKSRGRDESMYEVMIFVTPRILNYE